MATKLQMNKAATRNKENVKAGQRAFVGIQNNNVKDVVARTAKDQQRCLTASLVPGPRREIVSQDELNTVTRVIVPEGCTNIDGPNVNYLLLPHLAPDTYAYLGLTEPSFTLEPGFLAGKLVTERHRSILVDWLLQVANRFQLTAETWFLAVNVADRYLSKVSVTRPKLQLVGVTALFTASKFEEVYPPPISDFASITDRTYNEREIRQMEINVMKVLMFDINAPLPCHYLRRFSRAANVTAIHHNLSKYLLELSVWVYCLVTNKPSQIAAAACLASRVCVDGAVSWDETLHYYSGQDLAEIVPLSIAQLTEALTFESEQTYKAIFEKFAGDSFRNVAKDFALFRQGLALLKAAELR